jgi:CheY-like chemotaxis protein
VRQVLVIDDDEDLRDLLCQLFRSSGQEPCIEAASVADLERQEQAALACSVALLDINLGRGQPTGLDAYRWLKRRAFSGKIVFLTGHAASHPEVQQALALSDARVLSKPVSIDVLETLTKETSRELGSP